MTQQQVDKSIMSSVIDRFGREVHCAPVTPADKNTARITAPIMDSPVFFGWLAGFGAQMHIEKPQSLAAKYQKHLQAILATY